MDTCKVHAYTDDNGLTLFAVEMPSGHVLQFGAYVTEFELKTDREELTSMFDGHRSFAPVSRSISIEAQVVGEATRTVRRPPQQVAHDVRQIGPTRREIEP